MSAVFGDADRGMVDRTAPGCCPAATARAASSATRALDSFGSASPEVTNGYITQR
jgi:hypothetical protein